MKTSYYKGISWLLLERSFSGETLVNNVMYRRSKSHKTSTSSFFK